MSTVRPVTGSDPDCAHLCSLLTSRHAARNIALTDAAQGNSERQRRFYLIPLGLARRGAIIRENSKRDFALQTMAAFMSPVSVSVDILANYENWIRSKYR